MKSIKVKVTLLALGMALFFLGGCAALNTTQPTRFYVLSPMAGITMDKKMASAEISNISIGIGPVSLPKYLRKSQIVTRTGNNELHLAEFDRWAGKVEEDIGRVIAENLAQLLATEKVLAYPATSAVVTDYTIEVAISRLEGMLGESVELIARWAIFDGRGTNIREIASTRKTEAVLGPGYGELVAAQSRALTSLSHDLAMVIIDLSGR